MRKKKKHNITKEGKYKYWATKDVKEEKEKNATVRKSNNDNDMYSLP